MPHGVLATYAAQIVTIIETKDVKLCLHVFTGEKFPNFCAERFSGPQNS